MDAKEEIKIKKFEGNDRKWNEMAGSLARSFCPPIYPCKHCKYPVVSGYCCGECGSNNPSN